MTRKTSSGVVGFHKESRAQKIMQRTDGIKAVEKRQNKDIFSQPEVLRQLADPRCNKCYGKGSTGTHLVYIPGGTQNGKVVNPVQAGDVIRCHCVHKAMASGINFKDGKITRKES